MELVEQTTQDEKREVIARLQEERTELIFRAHKLRQYLAERKDQPDSKNEELMRIQNRVMLHYAQVLGERIALLQGELYGKA